ncbi:unnamed protein product [Cylindrotheca closterium]|uniref:SET domain-containing protein n=1 Tax=Cylindrotheca closterium TaxID=2856 RepID=A0AAD2CRK3_9STRA|nr:unnamed protein product [Cylindrotheca closterium]
MECGVWVGLSTLPGTGIGMFAGKDFRKGETLLDYGDHIIPIVDISSKFQNPKDIDRSEVSFLWTEYTWNADYFGMSRMGMDAVEVASAGFGAAANSFMDFVNVKEEDTAKYTVPDNIHRSRDPEAGAFTYHHSRGSFANDHIRAGQELFVSYGDKWFKGRKKLIGPVPITKDHVKAENLHVIFQHKLLNRRPKLKAILEEMWHIFVGDPEFNPWESSLLAALPEKDEYDLMEQIGLIELKRRKMVRSQEWLEEHAVCADNFYFGVSSIPKAGHGAFAKRKLKAGTAILPVPLIHIPDRSILEMYHPSGVREKNRQNKTSIPEKGQQLLVNYCLGHANSTMLLSPYGPAFNLINHNQTRVNVKLQWALPKRSNHFPEMLEKDPSYFSDIKSAKLAMEVVALRDIEPDEEILLDYGEEWEAAWQNHVQTWNPVPDAHDYVSAAEMNKRPERLRTEFEQIYDPYPSNLAIVFKESYEHNMGPYRDTKEIGHKNVKFSTGDSNKHTCEILSAKPLYKRTVYTAVLGIGGEGAEEMVLLENLPREAFEFQDRPHTEDLFLPNAFRHDIRIPDEMFPEAWKNNMQ